MSQRLPATIDEVLAELDRIIDHCIAENDARGIFAYVYRRTTAEIKDAIVARDFDDNQSLEKFDVAFANYYIRAYRQYLNGETCSLVWERSFEACRGQLTVVQHILLGMNAHINLDLGLTTAVQARGKDIRELESDFLKVNEVLARVVDDLQRSLSRVSPLFFLLDWFGQTGDEKLINFSMRRAREQAWNLAVLLHSEDEITFGEKRDMADRGFALFAQKLWKPNSKLVNALLRFIRFFEEKNVGRIIRKMRG